MTTKVAVFGARGRMGAEVCRAVEAADDLELVAAVDAGDDRAAATRRAVAVAVPEGASTLSGWCSSMISTLS